MPAERTLQANLDLITRTRLELGISPLHLASERLEDARPELLEAMKMLDRSERRELHVRLGALVNELDALRSDVHHALVNELDALRGALAGGYGS